MTASPPRPEGMSETEFAPIAETIAAVSRTLETVCRVLRAGGVAPGWISRTLIEVAVREHIVMTGHADTAAILRDTLERVENLTFADTLPDFVFPAPPTRQ